MPTYGNDCCAKCCYNELKQDAADGGQRARKAKCALRQLTIDQPSRRYCINHPNHNPRKIQEPVGPVFKAGSYPSLHGVWKCPPNSPAIRTRLLALLEEMTQKKRRFSQSFTEMAFDAVVINHLEALREQAALPGILRLLEAADTACFGLSPAPLTVPGAYVIRAAIQAGLVISNGECLNQVESWLYAESVAKTKGFGKGNDPFTLIRLGVVEALENCPRSETESLLEDALEDPHPQVREQARAVLRRRKGVAA